MQLKFITMVQRLKCLLNSKRMILPFIWALFILPDMASAQLAEGEDKFLGNIMPSSEQYGYVVRNDFGDYWNQVTPENSGKWGSVESTRDNYSWYDLDEIYDYSRDSNIPFKQHVMVWGNQAPDWIDNLSAQEQRAEVEEWFQDFSQRYPDVEQVEVANELLLDHANDPITYKGAIGGDNNGANNPFLSDNEDQYGPYGTGWDFVIWAFAKARQYFPDAELMINDFNIINDDQNSIDLYLDLINILNERGLIDAIGIQCHHFSLDGMTAAQITSNLDRLAAPGLPIYVTELDITGDGSEQQQRNRYETVFPAFWEHPDVAGVTLWGYVEGDTWEDGTGIITSDGTEQPAMQWLKEYFNSDAGTDNLFINIQSVVGTEELEVYADGTLEETITVTDTSAFSEYGVSVGDSVQTLRLEYVNDTEDRNLEVDYVRYNDNTFEAENQVTNTAVYVNADSACGDGSYSEIMDCNGYIEFGDMTQPKEDNFTVRATGVTGEETLEVVVDGNTMGSWTMDTTMQEYTTYVPSGASSIRVRYPNDEGDRDAQVDYIVYEDTTYEAEDQAVNTGSYANGSCGGGQYTEQMFCSGYIEFVIEPCEIDSDGDGVYNCNEDCPADTNKTSPGECGCNNTEESCLDCAGEPNGEAFIDSCGECAGGTTDREPVTDTSNCTVTQVQNSVQGENIAIYPNPFSSALNISLPSGTEGQAVILDFKGAALLTSRVSGNTTLQLQELPQGMYLLRLRLDDDVYHYKITKE